MFTQIMEFAPWTSFARIVHRYDGNAGVRTLSCAEQLRAMAFAQLTWRESLRDIEASLAVNAAAYRVSGVATCTTTARAAWTNALGPVRASGRALPPAGSVAPPVSAATLCVMTRGRSRMR